MSQVQSCGDIGTALQPRTDSCITSNHINREMNFVMASSRVSEDLLTQTYHGLHRFPGPNQPSGGGVSVLFQDVQITPSTPSHDIISGQNMDSMVGTPSWEQLLVRGQPSPSSHPKSAIQTNDGISVVHPRQPVDRDLPIPNRPPTAKDWQVYRSIFTQLYKVENKTLREAMNIMKEQYHFRAR
jgi:Clr5 domain